MTKINRNDPCPCGSGKKYKKCCGHTKVIPFPTELINQELIEIQHQLIDFSLTQYENELEHFCEKFILGDTFDEDLLDAGFMQLTIWAIFNLRIADQGRTIFEEFLRKKRASIKRPQTLNLVESWANGQSAILKIISKNKQELFVENVFTNEELTLQMSHEIVGELDGLLIGFPIQTSTANDLAFSFIEVPTLLTKEIVETIYEQFDEEIEQDILYEAFPELITIIIDVLSEPPLVGVKEIAWENPQHKVVATLLEKELRTYPEEFVSTAIMLWSIYCVRRKPIIRKPLIYVAAMEYCLGLITNTPVPSYTQADLAEKYKISTSTISNRVSDIFDNISDVMDEMEADLEGDEEIHLASPPDMLLERELSHISQLAQNHDFQSIEELNDFIKTEFNNPTANYERSNPKEKAQELLYQAMEITGAKRKKLIDQALQLYPNSVEAYRLLGDDAPTPQKAVLFYKKAIEMGELELGQQFFIDEKGHFWLDLETRPYMRAKLQYAECLDFMGQKQEAIEELEHMLELNPNDNQGVRYLLCKLLIEENELNKAQTLLELYSEESTANLLYNRVLVEYLSNGRSSELQERITEAKAQNPFVPAYLLGQKPIPKVQPEFVGFGDELEAIAYVQDHYYLWKNHKSLLLLLGN